MRTATLPKARPAPATAPAVAVFVDPPSAHYLRDALFDAADPALNRDGGLLPYARAREALAQDGIGLHTADHLHECRYLGTSNHYWSMGPLENYAALASRGDVELRGFMLFEPPLVSPGMYAALPQLTRDFAEVFVHNIVGDGYSLRGVDVTRLRKFHWPQPYDDVVEPHWSKRQRRNALVVIAGNHNPGRRKPEQYSARIEAIAELEPLGCIDLFGRGWERWWSRSSLWRSYWWHRRSLLKAYRGPCDSKLATLSGYRFSLCLENMPMRGYVTEKIFDCFYSGTVPVYQGGADVAEFVPADTFIDARDFASWSDLWLAIKDMSDAQWQGYRERARTFLAGPGGRAYYRSLSEIFVRSSRSTGALQRSAN